MNSELQKRDLKLNWHPYTQMKDCEELPPIPIKKASGIKVYDHDGNFFYDTISSWWCNVHGHCHPAIQEAIKAQVDQLDHVLFAGFTHEPAIKLSEKLIEIAPEGLSRVFYSDNGSTAVEVALKMAVQFWTSRNRPDKHQFMCLDRGYHGDTVGAMSVSGFSDFNAAFRPIMFDSYRVPTPYCYRCQCGESPGRCSLKCLRAAEDVLEKNADNIAAMIIEPMLIGAGGMIVYPAFYMKGMKELAEKYDVLFIADEVATGFGRTGRMFACEHGDVSPDIMCISKGITSGSLPLGATLMSDSVFNEFYGEYSEGKTFYHGHTYSANPIACRAACRSIELFSEENTLAKVEMINNMLKSFLDVASAFPKVGDTRSIGVVGAIEMVENKETKEPFPPERRLGVEIYKRGLQENLILRPLGDVIYFFLPLCSEKDELEDIFSKATRVIASVQ